MEKEPGKSVALNVVVLTCRGQWAERLGASAGTTRTVRITDDAYLAAVELLTAARPVLVVDVGVFRPWQDGLLALADRRKAPVLGVGGGRAGGHDAAKLALTTPADLDEALRRIDSGGPDPSRPAPSRQEDSTHGAVSQPPQPIRPAEDVPPAPAEPAETTQVLTPAEISALLKPQS